MGEAAGKPSTMVLAASHITTSGRAIGGEVELTAD